jgi:ComF family protein
VIPASPIAGAARAIVRGAMDLLLPRACAVCAGLLDAGDRGLVCGRCWARVRTLPSPRCDRCGHPRRRATCSWCDLLPPYVRAARSVCWTGTGSASAIVHALKYQGWHAVAEGMADRMARLDWPSDVLAERTALVPVPLSPVRERERGYNQSTMLARALGGRCGLPVWDDLLRRTRATTSQTRLTPEERRSNVSDAFSATAVASRERLRGTHLVLVDDVVTTAATLVACAAALHAGGVRIVSVVTFARAPAPGDRS